MMTTRTNCGETIDELLADAQSQTGLADFGGLEFRNRLEALVEEALASGLNAAGRAALLGFAGRTLRNRLLVQADRARWRGIAEERIAAPLIVIGLPRSGTTFLHSLLAQDPAARSPLQWEVSRPSPPPQAAQFRTDERIALSRAETSVDPELLQMHIQDAELPVECGSLINFDFANFVGNFAMWNAPQYLAQWRRPAVVSFAWHKRMLQHLQFGAPGHWVLKYPGHLLQLPALLETYPDARIIFLHRSPISTIVSVASLVAYFRRRHYDAPDRLAIGRSQAELWEQGLRFALSCRDQAVTGHRILDLPYSRLTAEPLVTVRQIYSHFGSELSGGAEQAMASWLETYRLDSYRGKFGKHRYTPQEYGLTQGELEERFSFYLDRHEF